MSAESAGKEKRNEVLTELKTLLTEFAFADEEALKRSTEESKLDHDLNIDSLGLVEVIMAIEEKYKIEIFTDDEDNLLTVGDVITLIIQKTE